MTETKYESIYTGEQIDDAVKKTQRIKFDLEREVYTLENSDLNVEGTIFNAKGALASLEEVENKTKKDSIVIEKIKNEKEPPYLKIIPQISSDVDLETVQIFLQLKRRKKGYNRWWHPINNKYGYSVLAGTSLSRWKGETGENLPKYPLELPEWMEESGGNIQTEFSIKGELILKQGYFKDLLKPTYKDNWDWSECHILGGGPYLPLEMRFILVQKNNKGYKTLAISEETVKIGENGFPIKPQEDGTLRNFFIKIN